MKSLLKPKKLAIVLVVLLVVGGLGYKETRPKPIIKLKIHGTVYVLPQNFLLNLSDGRYAKLTVGLVLAPGQSDGETAATQGETAADGIGTLPEEAVVDDIITNIITNEPSSDLIEASGRATVKHEILSAILSQTDVKATRVLFPVLAVQ